MNDPLVYMARLCKDRASKGGDDHYHIFINSVDGIARICRLADLNPANCRIVCSQGKDSKDDNQKKLGIYTIQTNQDPVRLFNFYTSTCFEGQDIFDKKGRTFIVSERYKAHTQLDVMTSLRQVCGRIRDSEYGLEINQFYADSIHKDITPEEYELAVLKDAKEAENFALILNATPEGSRKERMIRDFVQNDKYMTVKDRMILVDPNLVNREIALYWIANHQYANQRSMNASLTQAGFQVKNELIPVSDDKLLDGKVATQKASFKDLFEEYVILREPGRYNLNLFRKDQIESERPLIKEAYENLTPERVRELNYNQSKIKNEMVKRMNEKLDTKVFLMLDDQLPRQVAIPKSEIKEKLESIYKELKIKAKAKSTDLRK